jgi:hypothetical protein
MSVTRLGTTTWRNQGIPFGIRDVDRLGHMLVLGKTGVGKSTLLANIAISDMRAGHGLAVIDPHGALIEEVLLHHVPSHRVKDVIYLNPLDIERPVPFNPLDHVDPRYHHLVVSGVLSIMKKMWADSWGNRLEHILRYSLLTLLAYPGTTLLDVSRLLLHQGFRQEVVGQVASRDLRNFWRQEFDGYATMFRNEMSAPVLNKVGQFPVNPILRSIVGQADNTFRMREVMDSGKILLVNLARGRMGEDASQLLGAMIITRLWLAALSRQDVPEDKRRPFYLLVDEAHSLPGSFVEMLSETRKYKLGVTVAFQYLDQLNEAFRAAIFGNVGTMMSFRTGAEDAATMAREFNPIFREVDFVNLPKYTMVVKLLIDGVPSQGFSAQTLPLGGTLGATKDEVVERSRNTYGRPQTQNVSARTSKGQGWGQRHNPSQS